MADGKGCKCGAYGESECGCDADWTPQELIEARAEIDRLRLAIARLAEQDATLSLLCKRDGSQVVPVTMDATLTDEEREAIWTVAESYAGNDDDPECERIARVMQGLWQRTK